MAILLTAHRLRKSYGAKPLFERLSFSIESGERIGLIGPNGAGKSTLLSLLAGRVTPDEGDLALSRGLRVGYLEQVPRFTPGATILSSLLETTGSTGGHHDWESLASAQELISRLELDRTATPDTPVDSLSGGWKKRVALGRELIRTPDLLLLDEPTNHLDVESILWLEQFIAQSGLTTLTITHDRLFLQKVSNRILELDPRNPDGILSVRGDYSRYLETKELMLAAQDRRETVLRNTLRRETEWLRRGAKARTTKQQARIHRHGELSAELQDVSDRNRSRTARLDFETASRLPRKLIDAQGISKSWGGRTLFSNVDLRVSPGTRLGILGPNGSGKTTLIRVLLGEETPDTGTIARSEHLQVAYFSQHREALDPEASVMKTLCPRGEFVEFRGNRIHIRSYLDRFLFSPTQMDMPVGRLSGGEQSRVLLARLMLEPANVLVLDEPTNDLDLATLNVLEETLLDFEGAILLVSHDRYFIDQVSTELLAIDSGALHRFADLSQWEAWRSLRLLDAQTSVKPSLTPPPSQPSSKKRLGYKDQRELDGMEARIHEAEAELAARTSDLEKPEIAGHPSKLRETTSEIARLQAEVDRLYSRWEELLSMIG